MSEIMLHPWTQLLIKMTLLGGLLWWLNGLRMAAKLKAWVWRVGLLVLLFLPWLNQSMPLLQIPVWSTVTEVAASLVVPANLAQFTGLDRLTGPAVGWWTVGLIWASVALILLFQLVRQMWHWHMITQQARVVGDAEIVNTVQTGMRQLGLRQQPRVVVSPNCQSPCTWGWFRPVIVLPDSMSQGAAKAAICQVVLWHEMAHIKRHDWAWLISAQIITAVCWFNPMFWWIKSRMINSFEAACDDLVLQQNIKPSLYAEALLGFHPQTRTSLIQVTAMMAQPSILYQRLQLILNPQLRSQPMNSKKHHLLLATATVATALIAVSQLTTTQEVPVPPSPAGIHETGPSQPHPDPVHPTHATPAEVPHLAQEATHPETHRVIHPAAPTRPDVLPFPVRSQPTATMPHSPHESKPTVPSALPRIHATSGPGHRPSAPDAEALMAVRNKQQVKQLAYEADREMRFNQERKQRREAERKVRIEAERRRQSELSGLHEQQQLWHQDKLALKQELARIERQKQQLIEAQQRRQAELLALVEMERQHSHAELQRLQQVEQELQQEAKKAAANQP